MVSLMPAAKTKTPESRLITQTTETEICLAGPFTLALLRKSQWFSEVKPIRQQLRAVYFDTPAADIAKAGAGLRIRRESGSWVQTLKIETASGSRIEYSHILKQKTLYPLPEIAKEGLPTAGALKAHRLSGAAIRALKEPSSVQPLVEVRVTRQLWLVHFEQSHIAVALDIGSVGRPPQPPPGMSSTTPQDEERLAINELELELMAGTSQGLWGLAAALIGWLPPMGFGLEPRSKVERGLAWAYPALAEAASRKARQQTRRKLVAQDRSLGTVLGHHLKAAVITLSYRIIQVRSRIDPEDTHQARVALRQIRTLLKLLDSAGFPRLVEGLLPRCAEVADALGELRDLDVVIDAVVQPLVARLPKDPALRAMAKGVEQYREAIRKTLRQQLAEREIPLLLFALGQLSEEMPKTHTVLSSEEFARCEARRLRKRVARRERICATEPSAQADHRLRLAHKALRYAIPILQDLNAPQDLKAWAKASAKAQETLGLAQDKATARKTITNALRASPMDATMQARALAVIEGFLLAQQ